MGRDQCADRSSWIWDLLFVVHVAVDIEEGGHGGLFWGEDEVAGWADEEEAVTALGKDMDRRTYFVCV